MRLILILLVTCVIMAVLKLAIIALLVVLVITILWGAYAHPGELFGTLAFFLIANLLMTHTVACLMLIGFLGFWLIVRRSEAPSNTDESNR